MIGKIKSAITGLAQNLTDKTPAINKNLKSFRIGRSTNLSDINCYQIGQGKLSILFVSCFHGNEVGTAKLAYHLINWLFENCRNYPNLSFYVIPCLNPDGYKLAQKNPDYVNGGRIGRFNGRNVDLNRNFDTPNFKTESVWSFGKNYSQNTKVYCGKKGNSEPEIQTLIKLFKDKNIKVLYAFHNRGKDVMSNNIPEAQKLAKKYAQIVKFHFVPNEEWVPLKQTGTTKEWTEINNILYIEIESPSRWDSDWQIQKPAIAETLKELNQVKS